MQAWDALIQYINLFNEREVIYRSSLVNQVLINISAAGINERTIDVYRSILTKAGYLRIVGRGAYIIEKIPEVDLTYTQAKNESEFPRRQILETNRNREEDIEEIRRQLRESSRIFHTEREKNREDILLMKLREKIFGGTDEFIKEEEFQL